MRSARFSGALIAAVIVAICAVGFDAGVRADTQAALQKPQILKGLSFTATALTRGKIVSLGDCPPGANSQRGVIRPIEDNEFVTVTVDIQVLPAFAPVTLTKPVLHDAAGKSYNTGQTFANLAAEPAYSCDFSFRVPTGTKVARLTIDEASLDLTAFDAPVGAAGTQSAGRLNSTITLLEGRKPVFGLYAPSARQGRGGRRGAAPTTPPPAPKTPTDLAKDTLDYTASDYMFSGSMEGGVDRGLPAFAEYAAAMRAAGASARTHPLIVKTPKITGDAAKTTADFSRILNSGVSGLMFVGVESADEVREGLAAMRFTSRGGTRPDQVGDAPAYWGLSEAEYKRKADLWPANPNGELVNWVIVESKEGLAHVREIAAVPGIGVLWPGAGTLRGVFSTTGPDGQRVPDTEGWEHAIQQVLAACKEFNVACGFPANENDIEMRMQQGFSVFVMNWGEAGFRTIEKGRTAARR